MSDSIRTIPVRLQPPYDVLIGSGLLGRCGDYLAALLGQRKIAVLTDDTVAPLYLDTVTAALEDAGFTVCSHVFPAGEGHKNLSTLGTLLEFLASEHLTRTDCVAALGAAWQGTWRALQPPCTSGASGTSSCPPRFWPRWPPPWAVKPP